MMYHLCLPLYRSDNLKKVKVTAACLDLSLKVWVKFPTYTTSRTDFLTETQNFMFLFSKFQVYLPVARNTLEVFVRYEQV